MSEEFLLNEKKQLLTLYTKLKHLEIEVQKELTKIEENIFNSEQWLIFQNDLIKKDRSKPNMKRMTLFVDIEGNPLPSNPEAIAKEANKTHSPLYRKKYDWNLRIWTDVEKIDLLNVIQEKLKNDMSYMISEYLISIKKYNKHQYSYIYNKTKDQFVHFKTKDLFEHSEEHLLNYINIEDKSQGHLCHIKSISEYWEEFWNIIARSLTGRNERNGIDCEIQWIHYLDETRNIDKWTVEEDNNLISIAKLNGCRYWKNTALLLKTGRSAYQCFSRYQNNFNLNSNKRDWTKEEENILLKAVNTLYCNMVGPCKWSRVATSLPGRTANQCRHRYLSKLQPNIKRGYWDLYEDTKLQILVQVYGRGKWSNITKHLIGRSDIMCRERYENILAVELTRGSWANSEVNKLIKAVNLYGIGSWSNIAKMVPGRTDGDCLQMWNRIDPFKNNIYYHVKQNIAPKRRRNSTTKYTEYYDELKKLELNDSPTKKFLLVLDEFYSDIKEVKKPEVVSFPESYNTDDKFFFYYSNRITLLQFKLFIESFSTDISEVLSFSCFEKIKMNLLQRKSNELHVKLKTALRIKLSDEQINEAKTKFILSDDVLSMTEEELSTEGISMVDFYLHKLINILNKFKTVECSEAKDQE